MNAPTTKELLLLFCIWGLRNVALCLASQSCGHWVPREDALAEQPGAMPAPAELFTSPLKESYRVKYTHLFPRELITGHRRASSDTGPGLEDTFARYHFWI